VKIEGKTTNCYSENDIVSIQFQRKRYSKDTQEVTQRKMEKINVYSDIHSLKQLQTRFKGVTLIVTETTLGITIVYKNKRNQLGERGNQNREQR